MLIVLGTLLSCCVMMMASQLEVTLIGVGLLLLFLSNLLMCQQSDGTLTGLVMMDGVSSAMVFLTVYIGMMMFVVSARTEWFSSFNSVVLSICVMLIVAFSAVNVFFFFFFFEGVLVPTVLLILGWGYQPERVQAVSYMVVYMVVGSFPLLYGLVLLSSCSGSHSWGTLVVESSKSFVYFGWLYSLAFLVKLPMYPFHLWLPKAHVEAPVAGSMVLAGLMLKLGGYGLIRMGSILVLSMSSLMSVMVVVCCLYGGFLAGVVCMRQTDMKALIAYASIGHMSLVLVAIVSGMGWGEYGALLLMVGHGLCSSGLFVAVDCMYQSSGSRLLMMNKGFLCFSPLLSFLVFFLLVGNIPAPVSLNLFGEIVVYSVVASVSISLSVLLCLLSFVSGCYSLYMYTATQHGKMSGYKMSMVEGNMSGMLVLVGHLVPLNSLVVLFSW